MIRCDAINGLNNCTITFESRYLSSVWNGHSVRSQMRKDRVQSIRLTASSATNSCCLAMSNSFCFIFAFNCVNTISFCWSNTSIPSIASISFGYGNVRFWTKCWKAIDCFQFDCFDVCTIEAMKTVKSLRVPCDIWDFKTSTRWRRPVFDDIVFVFQLILAVQWRNGRGLEFLHLKTYHSSHFCHFGDDISIVYILRGDMMSPLGCSRSLTEYLQTYPWRTFFIYQFGSSAMYFDDPHSIHNAICARLIDYDEMLLFQPKVTSISGFLSIHFNRLFWCYLESRDIIFLIWLVAMCSSHKNSTAEMARTSLRIGAMV